MLIIRPGDTISIITEAEFKDFYFVISVKLMLTCFLHQEGVWK